MLNPGEWLNLTLTFPEETRVKGTSTEMRKKKTTTMWRKRRAESEPWRPW